MLTDFGERVLLNAPPDQDWAGFYEDGGRCKVMDAETGLERSVEPEDKRKLTGGRQYLGHRGQTVYLIHDLDACLAGGGQ
jgi:hypothetical protein